MKSLLLLRHAQSADKQMGQRDLDRVLTKDGEAQASDVGDYLAEKNIHPDVILCSHAIRTLSTAAVVARKIDYAPDKIIKVETIYEASLNALVDSIKKIEDHLVCVMLVGHNPSVSMLGEFLTEKHIGNLDPAGLLYIKFSFSSWKDIARGSGKLITATLD